jgi:hypothetical protein
MPGTIEAKEAPLGRLYSPDFLFLVPDYQRPLSWARENFQRLFDDILGALTAREEQYFLGSIILKANDANLKQYEVVDGQQRITALAILLAAIRDFATNPSLRDIAALCLYQKEDPYRKIPESMRIQPWRTLEDTFRRYIYAQGGTTRFAEEYERKAIKPKDEEDPLHHLSEAIDVFRDGIANHLSDPAKLDEFVTYLLSNVYIVYIVTSTFSSAYRLFNVLNTRGLPLNTSDLLKSENLEAAEREHIRASAAEKWSNIERSLGREELETVIGFTRTILVKEAAKVSIYDEYDSLVFKGGLKKRGREFIDYLEEVSEVYRANVLEGSVAVNGPAESEYRVVVELMKQHIPFTDWIPPLLAFARRFRSDHDTVEFLRRLEKKTVIEWMAGFSATERGTSFNGLLRAVEAADRPETASASVFQMIHQEPRRGRVARVIDFSDKTTVESILRNRLDDKQLYGLYGGRIAKYVLLRLDMNEWEVENLQPYPGSITVEHVLPQTPKGDSDWKKLFTEEDRAEWTNRLGNLVLLSGSRNSSAQNFDFETKKTKYFHKKSTPFRITRRLDSTARWTRVELKERHSRLLDDACETFLQYQ